LNRFDINDILQIENIDENELRTILDDFEKSLIIKKISENEYSFIKSLPITSATSKQNSKPLYKFEPIKYNINPSQPESLFPEEEERKFFDSCTERDKKNIIKCITLFRLSTQVRNKDLKRYLKEFGEIHPDYKMSYQTLYRYRKRYYEIGIRGLCYAYAHRSVGKTVINPEMYKLFKEYYLSSNRYSLNEAWKKVQENFIDEYIPSPMTFRRQLSQELTKDAIKQLRNTPIKLPDFNFKMTDKLNEGSKHETFEKFIDAANHFINSLKDSNNSKNIHIRNLKKYIIPYFEKLTFEDINQNIIIDYENKLVLDGYSAKSINRIISTLSLVYYKYSNKQNKLSFQANNTILPSNEQSYYDKNQIQNFITKKSHELWIVCLGITPAELSCLRYEDIDFNTQTIKISRAVMSGIEQRYKVKYRLRDLKIPKLLFEIIDKNKSGLIFGKINVDNFNKLLNTHIYLLLEKNVQLHIISNNLGCVNISEFVNRFNYLLDKNIKEDIDMLN
jgi:hypothetical protein